MLVTTKKEFCKAFELLDALADRLLKDSAAETRIDLVERGIFESLLALGKQLLQDFIDRSGDGDEGPTKDLDDKVLKRSSGKRSKKYRSIFGVLEVARWVYGVRDGQKIEYAAVDAKLGLPKHEQSYVLEDWLSRFSVQKPFACGVSMLNDLLGINTTARMAEAINQELGGIADGFEQDVSGAANVEVEGEIVAVSADGKGVPMRSNLEDRQGQKKPAWRKYQEKKQRKNSARKATNRLCRGQVRTRKQMAYVGAIYTIKRWICTPDDILDELLLTNRKPTLNGLQLTHRLSNN